jgi:hypothetical protein
MANENAKINMCWAVLEDEQDVDYGEVRTSVIAVFTDEIEAKEFRSNIERKDKRRRNGDYYVSEAPLNPTPPETL